MRILAILVVVWGLVGMPALCRAGVLVECCVATHHSKQESCGCSCECPNDCPDELPDECPNDTGSSDERDCSSCAEVCRSVFLPTGKLGCQNAEITLAPAVHMTDAFTGVRPSLHGTSRDMLYERPHEILPFLTSDRPLLI